MGFLGTVLLSCTDMRIIQSHAPATSILTIDSVETGTWLTPRKMGCTQSLRTYRWMVEVFLMSKPDELIFSRNTCARAGVMS